MGKQLCKAGGSSSVADCRVIHVTLFHSSSRSSKHWSIHAQLIKAGVAAQDQDYLSRIYISSIINLSNEIHI